MKIDGLYENRYDRNTKILVYKSLKTNDNKIDYMIRHLTGNYYKKIGDIERISDTSYWDYIGQSENYPEYLV
jgi:hypothetical protein